MLAPTNRPDKEVTRYTEIHSAIIPSIATNIPKRRIWSVCDLLFFVYTQMFINTIRKVPTRIICPIGSVSI